MKATHCSGGCERRVADCGQEWIYTVNPDGGYGYEEVLICATCLQKPENAVIKERLLKSTPFTQEQLDAVS